MLFLHINRTITKTAHHQPIIGNLAHKWSLFITNKWSLFIKVFWSFLDFYQISREGFVPAFIHIRNFFIAQAFQETLDDVNYSSQPRIEWISLVNYLKDLLDLTGKWFCYVLIIHLSD